MFYITAIDKQSDASEKLTIRFYSACCKGNYIYIKKPNGKVHDDWDRQVDEETQKSIDNAIEFYKECIRPKI